jgi:hypothetical protein
MNSGISFTHVLNPFPSKAGSEHATASRVTWQSLRVAHARAAQQGIAVTFRAVILPGDEAAIEPPISETAYLMRTVQDVAKLAPRRLLPLIADILNIGSEAASTSHLIFSNMDIAVQPDFYMSLRDTIAGQVGPNTPFTVARTNIDAALADSPLETMYAATGPLGQGYDCFVIPLGMVRALDLGECCIGAPHFDNLLVMELDVLAPDGVKTMSDVHLTFHLGNDIAWAAMIDYVEHNLAQCLQAISRMRQRYPIANGSLFDRVDKRHFRRNATFLSALLRKVRRVPGLSNLILKGKRALGRQF